MIQMSLYLVMITMNIVFMMTKHPLTMGMTLLMQTILISMYIGLMSKTFWFSYVLFLIFVGGMLVMFIYVTSLASNEMFKMEKMILMATVITMMLIILWLNTDNMMMSLPLMNMEMLSTEMSTSFLKENMLNLNKLYNYPHNMLTIMMITYLLITLIVTVKIVKKSEGPLRPMN